MYTVRLVTEKLEFIHEAEIPPFCSWPEIILWGTRVFALLKPGGERHATYVECFSYMLPCVLPSANVGD